MNRIEDRLTSLLTRSAEAVDVEADLDRVRDSSPAVVALDDRRGRSRRRSAILLAGAAATATIAVATYAVSRSGEDVDVRNPATSPVDDGGTGDDPAEGNGESPDTPPRFLITADGWELERSADYGGDTDAEAFFQDGSGRTIPIWRSSREDLEAQVNNTVTEEHPDIMENFSDPLDTIHTATGEEVTLYEMTGDGWAAAWYVGDYGFLADTNTNAATYILEHGDDEYIPRDEFTEILGTVELVDEETWLATHPDDHATNEDELAVVVENALQDVPLPDGTTVDTIVAELSGSIAPDEQVDMTAASTVACAWIDVWIAADGSGDTEARQEAVEAMASSDQWPVLADPDRILATEIIEVGDAMAADERVQATTGEDPVWGPTQGEGYLRHIVCPDAWD